MYSYISYLLVLPITYYIWILYKIYRLKYSKKITGIDKYMMEYKNESTIYNSLLLNKNTEINSYIDRIRNKLRELHLDDTKIVEVRYMTDADETILCNTNYVHNDPPFKLIIDANNKVIWITANHAYHDGFSLMKTTNKILDVHKDDTYKLNLPVFNYIPIFSDYIILRTIYDYYNMKPASLKPLDGKTSGEIMIKIKSIFHLKYKLHVKNNNFIPLMIEKMTQIFFDIFPEHEYFNVGVLFAIHNPNKTNNVSSIAISIDRNDSVHTIEKKLTDRKHMVLGSYFLINSVNSEGKTNIDIMFSSIPVFKNDNYGSAHGAILPYISSPIYIFNSKINDQNTSSVHMRDNYIDYNKFRGSLSKVTDIDLYRVTNLY